MKDYAKASASYQALVTERYDWEAEWKQISEYLLPGRGIYTAMTRPSKRKLTTPKVINTVAEDALYVLTSGMHGGLTSPSRPWFTLGWTSAELNKFEPLKAWLQECEKRLHAGLQASNFYSTINSFYVEYAGFGTGCVYVGHDTDTDSIPFRFEILTAGEYAFGVNAVGRPGIFYRVYYLSLRQFAEYFEDSATDDIKKKVSDNDSTIDSTFVTILEGTERVKYNDFNYRQDSFAAQNVDGGSVKAVKDFSTPIATKGFHEFPYPLARWGTIGSDVYGIGPGSRSLPDIKRLQQMEKAFLMATHKAINPPLNAPARMRGKLNTLPGGYNYYSNPAEVVNEIYNVKFDYQGVGSAVERVEQRIQRNFFNDIFLTAARDPNATPYKATEVNAREQEKMLRLGPVIERLQYEFLQPVVERCFNIMLRKNLMPLLAPELAEMAGDYKITVISPLATAQRSVALQGINSFMAFLGNAAQFDQSILDNIDPDAAAREYADITGVQMGVLRTTDQVKKIREARQAKQQAMEKAQMEAALGQAGADISATRAMAQKTQAEAGLTHVEAQKTAQEMGMG